MGGFGQLRAVTSGSVLFRAAPGGSVSTLLKPFSSLNNYNSANENIPLPIIEQVLDGGGGGGGDNEDAL